MIKNVTMKNFRQHKNLSLSIGKGVTVIRGSNEAGKSTVFEAIMFAMFGVSSCRDNDLTSWGEPKNSHKVEVVFESEGVEYTVVRNQKSAELNESNSGLKVSGQTDVTRKVEEILNLKPNMGKQLMFVSQGETRGILSKGGQTESTKTIENLAELDVIENMIETLQSHYATGGVKQLESDAEKLNVEIQDLEAELQTKYQDCESIRDKRLKKAEAGIEDQMGEINEIRSLLEKLEDLQVEGEKAADSMRELNRNYQSYSVKVSNLESRKASLTETLSSVELVKVEPVSEDEIIAIDDEIRKLRKQLPHWEAFNRYKPYSVEEYAKFTVLELEEILEKKSTYLENYKAQLATSTYRIRELEKELKQEAGDVCKSCGTVLKDPKEVEAHRNKIREELDMLKVNQKPLVENHIPELEDSVAILNKLLANNVPSAPGLIEEDSDYPCFPPKLVWVGQNIDLIEEYESKAKQLQKNVQAYDQYQAKLKALQNSKDQLVEVETMLEELKLEEPKKVTDEEFDEVLDDLKKLTLEIKEVNLNLRICEMVIRDLEDEVKAAHVEYDKSMFQKAADEERLQDLISRMNKVLKAIKDVELNAEMLKFLRQVKPQVADQVWATICHSVSTYFSKMRGVDSVVTKDGGFMVDGNNVSSLSGSTIDILGVAIRVALTKTFLPSSTMLLLDEPFAACSAERQASALAFITQCGFDQVVIITHEEATQSVADELITL